MASSYTTSFGIEKIGSGEQSGAWGTTSNHNLDILDRVASYSAFGLTGTTHTLTVREASPESGTENLQTGMYRVIKFTGALGGNNTVTVAPNTTAAYFIMINATTDSGSSGPYSVILTQGSGANITIANGKSAIVYMDGAGSGAAVVDALSNLALATLTASGDVTSSGTFNALGDTAASDKAAVGYAAAEGLVLTGQGSTNDVTIKNDADGEVMGVLTGTTTAAFTGQVTGTGFTGTLDGILGSGTPAAATVTTMDASGVATATTFEPDGDTSASDNAAIGYTAAEGLILTGQGSTNDITIKNDADADVLTVPTGTTTASVAAKLSLADASYVDISTPLLAGADHTYTGLTAQMLAGGAIAAFDLVCVHTTTQEVVEADASAYATARVIGIAPAAISDTATGTVLLHGFIRDDTWAWTAGSTLYLSETAGAMTHTAPSTDGAFVLVVGVALSPDVVYINPSMDVIEHA